MGFLDPNSWSNALSSDPTGSKYAANIASASSDKQIALQKQMYQDQLDLQRQMWQYGQAVQQPFVAGGTEAETQLRALTQPGAYFDQWTMDKAKQSVPYQIAMDPTNVANMMSTQNAAAAASGSFGSPGVANAIAQNLQQNALNAQSLGYDQWAAAYNRLTGRANPNSAQQVANQSAAYGANASGAMQNYANTASQAMNNAAVAQGLGVTGAAAAKNQAWSNIGSGFGNLLGDWIKGQAMGGGGSFTGSDPYTSGMASGWLDQYSPIDGASGVSAGVDMYAGDLLA